MARRGPEVAFEDCNGVLLAAEEDGVEEGGEGTTYLSMGIQ